MNDIVAEIESAESLEELTECLNRADNIDSLREKLHAEFMNSANYSTPAQWNRAVRLCECLAIIGWGSHEAVEAHADRYFNGYPNTFFITPDNDVRYLDAVWFRRDGGIVIDTHASTLHNMEGSEINPQVCQEVKLHSQRNWLPKCPVQIVRSIENCYPGSRPVQDSIRQELNPMLFRSMRPELYGSSLNRILIYCGMSFDDGNHCKTNHIIADEALKLRKSEYYTELLKHFSEEEIEREGLFMCPRYDIGPFRKDTGRVYATVYFEKEFSELPEHEQKLRMSEYFLTVIKRIAARRKNTDYDFGLLAEDFKEILDRWCSKSRLPNIC